MELVKGKSNKEEVKQEKLSYEKLEEVAKQLSEQNRMLYTELQKSDMTNSFKRLDYLFKVVENQNAFSSDFVVSIVDEIEASMAIPTEDKEEVQPNESMPD